MAKLYIDNEEKESKYGVTLTTVCDSSHVCVEVDGTVLPKYEHLRFFLKSSTGLLVDAKIVPEEDCIDYKVADVIQERDEEMYGIEDDVISLENIPVIEIPGATKKKAKIDFESIKSQGIYAVAEELNDALSENSFSLFDNPYAPIADFKGPIKPAVSEPANEMDFNDDVDEPAPLRSDEDIVDLPDDSYTEDEEIVRELPDPEDLVPSGVYCQETEYVSELSLDKLESILGMEVSEKGPGVPKKIDAVNGSWEDFVSDEPVEKTELETAPENSDEVPEKKSRKKEKAPKVPKVKPKKVKYARTDGHLVTQIPTPTCTGNVAPTLMATGYGTATYKNFYSVGHFPKLGILEVWQGEENVQREPLMDIDVTDTSVGLAYADSMVVHQEPVMNIDPNESLDSSKYIYKASEINDAEKIKDTFGKVKLTAKQKAEQEKLNPLF